jgi:hypothetical protein
MQYDRGRVVNGSDRAWIVWLATVVAVLLLALGIAAARPYAPDPQSRPAPEIIATPIPTGRSEFRDDGSNLLANPSFETDVDVDGIADGWVGDTANGKYSASGDARFGSVSQRITKEGISDPVAAFSAVQQRIYKVVAGRRYEVAVDYRYAFDSAVDPSRSVGIVIYALDASDRFIDTGTAIDWGWAPTATWVRKGLTVQLPANATSMVVEFRLSVNGSIWLDGASLREISP